MKLIITTLKRDWNDGIGLLPVSLFLKLGNDSEGNSKDIEQVYSEIIETDLRDIIIYGDIAYNIDSLTWLCSKLITEGLFVSIVTPIIPDIIQRIVANRRIYCINFEYRRYIKMIQPRDEDILYYNIDDVNVLQKLYEMNHNTKCVFSEKLIPKETLLENKIYYMYPYGGPDIAPQVQTKNMG